MKTKLLAFILLSGLAAYASPAACVLNPGSTPSCTLPPLATGQCVSYHAFTRWNNAGTLTVGVKLGDTFILPQQTIMYSVDPVTSIYEVRGEFCSTEAGQFANNSAVTADGDAVLPPSHVNSTEDTSTGIDLDILFIGQRGFGSPEFLGGTVDVR